MLFFIGAEPKNDWSENLFIVCINREINSVSHFIYLHVEVDGIATRWTIVVEILATIGSVERYADGVPTMRARDMFLGVFMHGEFSSL
nr:hypothetical protein BCU13_23750 [Vibrio lentus]